MSVNLCCSRHFDRNEAQINEPAENPELGSVFRCSDTKLPHFFIFTWTFWNFHQVASAFHFSSASLCQEPQLELLQPTVYIMFRLQRGQTSDSAADMKYLHEDVPQRLFWADKHLCRSSGIIWCHDLDFRSERRQWRKIPVWIRVSIRDFLCGLQALVKMSKTNCGAFRCCCDETWHFSLFFFIPLLFYCSCQQCSFYITTLL